MGDFVNALVSFLLVGAAVYFFVVLPVNRLMARMSRGEAPPDPTTRKCPECLSEVPIGARRCAACATAAGPGSAVARGRQRSPCYHGTYTITFFPRSNPLGFS